MSSAEALLYELHDRARDAGLAGYRRMTKAELVAALDGVGAGRRPWRRRCAGASA